MKVTLTSEKGMTAAGGNDRDEKIPTTTPDFVLKIDWCFYQENIFTFTQLWFVMPAIFYKTFTFVARNRARTFSLHMKLRTSCHKFCFKIS